MKRMHFALAAVLLAVMACSGGKTSQPAEEEYCEEELLPERFENDDLPKAADEVFDDFAYYFASNEHLQRRRINFPLTLESSRGKSLLEEEQWRMDSLFMTTGEYTFILDNPDQREQMNDSTMNVVTVEKIFFDADSVCQYIFCRNEGRWMLQGLRQQKLSDNANAPFLGFFHAFATDSAFQQNSLSSEIVFSGPDPDDDFARMEGFITPDSWEAFAPELPQDSIYNIVYTKLNNRSSEKTLFVCGISNGQELELTFRQRRGKWRLTRLTQ